MIAWVLACTGGSSPIVPLDTGSDGTFPAVGPDLVVDAGGGSEYTGEWVLPSISVKPNSELVIGWDAVTSDAWGEARDPTDFGAVVLLELGAQRLDALDALAAGALEDVRVDQWEIPLDGATTDLTASSFPGFDPEARLSEDPDTTWLLGLCDTDGSRYDLRTGLVLVPTAGQTALFLDVPDGAGTYTWQSKYDDGLRTEAGYDAYTFDWSALTADAYGQPLGPFDELFVGRYDGVTEGDDLTGEVHDLEARADEWWTGDPGGATRVDLGELTGFPGFVEGVYLIGLRCTTCWEPAPGLVVPVEVR
ncbi:MAG: hypothetical protein ABMA64_28135 [Myxococcota bacterium]